MAKNKNWDRTRNQALKDMTRYLGSSVMILVVLFTETIYQPVNAQKFPIGNKKKMPIKLFINVKDNTPALTLASTKAA